MDINHEGLRRTSGTLFVDPEHLVFQEHFPGAPVVPGSLICGRLKDILDTWLVGSGLAANRLDKFVFRRFMGPGQYSYTLEWSEGQARVWARVRDQAGHLVCEGSFELVATTD